jgi:3-oxoacyl-[acyl-carrier protein] reductase
MRLEGKTAIVTGGGSGFGEGIAKRFAAEGANVVVADINGNTAGRVAGEISDAGGDGRAVVADVTKSDDTAAMIGEALDGFGALDILINNAGMPQRNGPMLDTDEATFDRIFAVNVKSIYHAAIHAVPVMRERGGGVIINTASTAAARPRPGLAWYNGSKGAVVTITKSMAVELAPDKIRVCAINPVFGLTNMAAEFMGGEESDEKLAMFKASIPLGRPSTPEDVANAALYLASDEANFITGVCLEVDGGRSI